MTRVAIIGCGIIGAMIAYELSQISGLSVTVLDRQPPAQASTGAALGVLMGVISQKVKGRAWQMRLDSLRRYDSLIPELQASTGREILFNRHGILQLCFEAAELENWQRLAEIRQAQGLRLELLDPAQVQASYPQLCSQRIAAAVYSPQDRQVDPVALTLALVAAAKGNGVKFQFGVTVQGFEATPQAAEPQTCRQLLTTAGPWSVDWLVVAAGLGSTPLTASLAQPVAIQPVLGQALRLRLPQPLGNPQWQPAITGDDTYVIPLGQADYWVGATVEFPPDQRDPTPDPESLDALLRRAAAFCPALAEATVLRIWSGLRPRPEGRPAPVLGPLPGYQNVLLATGHYRNGVLLAPASAQAIRQLIASAS